jgi:carbon-monoxide dehydrogenase medium subunit
VKPSRFVLHIPHTLREALELIDALPNARLVAGGQSLMPMLNMRLAAPDHLVDLNRIAALSAIREEPPDVVFGAMTRQRDVELSPLVGERLPLLLEAIVNVGHRQTRNRGTIGGSLCHLDPSAELPAVAMAMDAMLTVTSKRATRTMSMASFAKGLMTTALANDEVLVDVRLRPWAPGHGWCFVEFARRHGDFAIVAAAAMVELDRARRITRISLTLGGVGPVPLRLLDAEKALLGGVGDDAALEIAGSHAGRCEAMSDPAYPSWYRQRLAQRLLLQAMRSALRRARPR